MLPSYVSLAPRPFPVRMWSAGRRKLHKLNPAVYCVIGSWALVAGLYAMVLA